MRKLDNFDEVKGVFEVASDEVKVNAEDTLSSVKMDGSSGGLAAPIGGQGAGGVQQQVQPGPGVLGPEHIPLPGEQVELTPTQQAEADAALEKVKTTVEQRKPVLVQVEGFSKRQTIVRRTLNSLNTKVADYQNLIDLDTKLSTEFEYWLNMCGVSEQQLENDGHQFRPSVIDEILGHSEAVLTAVKCLFVKIRDQFSKDDSKDEAVLETLEFLNPKETSTRPRTGSGSGSLELLLRSSCPLMEAAFPIF